VSAPAQRASKPAIPRLAFKLGEAAEALGVSREFFRLHVLPEVKVVRRGSVRLIARSELQAWLEREGSHTFDPEDFA
jgi:hypothetical protein